MNNFNYLQLAKPTVEPTQQFGNAKHILRSLKALGNPQMMLNNALARNPQLRAVLDECGGDYQAAFYKYAEMQGIDAEGFLREIMS